MPDDNDDSEDGRDLLGLLAVLGLGLALLFGLVMTMGCGPDAYGQVRGVTEAQVSGNARTYTSRQIFDILGAPLCATDPPSGACTAKDLCIDDTNNATYFCKAGTWAGVGGVPAGSTTEVQVRNGSAFGAAAGTSWNAGTSTMTIPNATITTTMIAGNVTATGSLTGGAYNFFAGYNQMDGPQIADIKPLVDGSGGVSLGTSIARFATVNVAETRGFCPGGPVSVLGNTCCVDPDDLDSSGRPTVKCNVGGQTVYLLTDTVKP